MSIKSPIEWCDSTINPVMGCDGCELSSMGTADAVEDEKRTGHCYAEALHVIRAGRPGYASDFFAPTQFTGRMAQAARWSDLRGTKRPDKPWLDGMPRMIFIDDMGDALSASVPFEFLCVEIIDNVASVAGSRHIWLWPTKRPRRMAEFSRWLKTRGIPWPRNLWAGTSVTSDKVLNRAAFLLGVESAPVYFLSCEPLLGPLVLQGSNTPDDPQGTWPSPGVKLYSHSFLHGPRGERRIGFVIVGGESGPGARPFALEWADDVRRQCAAAGVPFFFKQAGSHPYVENLNAWAEADAWMASGQYRLAPDGVRAAAAVGLRLRDRAGRDLGELPKSLCVRQLPKMG